MPRVNILKQIKVEDRWKLVSVPRDSEGRFAALERFSHFKMLDAAELFFCARFDVNPFQEDLLKNKASEEAWGFSDASLHKLLLNASRNGADR